LQSVSPLSETRYQHDPEHSYRALRVMFEDCAAHPGCREAYPDLEERFFSLVADLNEIPLELTMENPSDGSLYSYQVSGKIITALESFTLQDMVQRHKKKVEQYPLSYAI